MDTDDPFFSPSKNDKTIIRPVPGGRKVDLQHQAAAKADSNPEQDVMPHWVGLNPLEGAASGLLTLLTTLSTTRSHPEPASLKTRITREINNFQNNAQSCGIDAETVYTTRYILCTVLDEAVLNTPWGQSSDWAQQSLLSSFHQEVAGGERFFQLLKSLGQYPAKNLHLLELMYLCMALGFEGRYRIVQGSKDKLLQIKDWLYDIIQKQKGQRDNALSTHWQGVTDKRNPLIRFVPLWVFSATAAGLLATIYMGFLFHLNQLSDPVFKQLFTIKTQVATPSATTVKAIVPTIESYGTPILTLKMLLAEAIRNNEINIVETDGKSTLTIRGDGIFSSGRATINPTIKPLLHRIAQSINQLPGIVMVTGHTDNIPIRSARYPSNWHLSQQRAEAVSVILKHDLNNPERVIAEGRADLEPVSLNDSREGRTRNRRVEIVLIK